MGKGSNGLTGEYMFRLLTTDKGRYQLTTERLMSEFYRGSNSSETDGTFKAVCLSGIRTDENEGSGTDTNDANISGKFIDIIVRPLTPFGDILPDPRLLTDPKQINDAISTHKAMFLAKSDFGFKDQSSISFGQVINCYFEDGSIANSDFSGLRFQEPQGVIFDPSFKEISTIEGVATGITAFEAGLASLLGLELPSGPGKSTNIRGKRKKPVEYIVIHYSAAGGSKEAVLKYENKSTEYGYHYMVDRNGSHFSCAPDENIIWHAGGNKIVSNSNSIGLCIMNYGYEREGVKAKSNWITGKLPNGSKSLKWDSYTEASLKKAASLCATVLKKFSLTPDRIVGHSDIQKNKSDPGPAFDMPAFRIRVKKLL
tara:strand:- start:63 stop:1172 length:1110 start_codon:yes stop_codon:yes gene_type:complete